MVRFCVVAHVTTYTLTQSSARTRLRHEPFQLAFSTPNRMLSVFFANLPGPGKTTSNRRPLNYVSGFGIFKSIKSRLVDRKPQLREYHNVTVTSP